MSSTGCEMASSYSERVRSASPSVRSSSANLIHAWQLAGDHSRYFSYSVRHLSSTGSTQSSHCRSLGVPKRTIPQQLLLRAKHQNTRLSMLPSCSSSSMYALNVLS
jgi:hypothetical protein